VISGGIIVADEGNHGQADANTDIQGETLHLLNDAHRGQFDIAGLFADEIEYETGIPVSLEPVYCDLILSFDKDGGCSFGVDPESVRGALDTVGEAIAREYDNPLVTAVIEYVKGAIMEELGSAELQQHGTYEIVSEGGSEYVVFSTGNGAPTKLERTGAETLLYDGDDLTMEFNKK
jgi:hypothetical protein